MSKPCYSPPEWAVERADQLTIASDVVTRNKLFPYLHHVSVFTTGPNEAHLGSSVVSTSTRKLKSRKNVVVKFSGLQKGS